MLWRLSSTFTPFVVRKLRQFQRSVSFKNVQEYNDEIRALREQKKFKAVLALFEGMAEKGIVPNVATYSQIISIYAHLRQKERALLVLSGMAEKGIAPNVVTYNAAITACVMDGDWKEALRLFYAMCAKGFDPDLIIYSTVIKACEEGGETSKADQLIQRAIKNEGFFPISKNFAGVDMIDLHGHPCGTAKALIRYVLEQKRKNNEKNKDGPVMKDLWGDYTCVENSNKIVIVTGRGKHVNSKGKRGFLREEVVVYVTQELNMQVSTDPTNPGRLVVTIVE